MSSEGYIGHRRVLQSALELQIYHDFALVSLVLHVYGEHPWRFPIPFLFSNKSKSSTRRVCQYIE